MIRKRWTLYPYIPIPVRGRRMEKVNVRSEENGSSACSDAIPKPQPFHEWQEVPLKNPFCPYYGRCLNLAVEASWPQFTCCECRFQTHQMPLNPDAYEVKAYYNLLARIFVGD